MEFDTFLIAPSLQLLINEFLPAIDLNHLWGFSLGNKMSQIIDNSLHCIRFLLQKIDSYISFCVIDEK